MGRRRHGRVAGRAPSLYSGGVMQGSERLRQAEQDLRELLPVRHFEGARAHAAPADRLRHVVRAAHAFREEMLGHAPVRFYASCELIRVPYPLKYALRDAALLPGLLVHIVNRVFVVQLDTHDGVKTLLVSPSDWERNAETPYFHRLATGAGSLSPFLRRWLAPARATVPEVLQRFGIRPEAVDYVTYDHLHTQDLRRWLGPGGLLPNARLLVTRQEWASAKALLPPQRDWYCPGGLDGVDERRVVQLDGDVFLGEGVALVRTPGHTEGNHSIVVRTPEGLFVTSENGVCADAYAPHASRIPGLRRYARRTGMDVVLNGNTLEGALDQYVSMVAEREIAGKSPRHGDFYNTVASSELAPFFLAPGVVPTFSFGDLRFGDPVRL